MRTFRQLASTGITSLILLVLWAGLYLARRGFTHEGRDQIERLFADRGFPVNMKKVTLDPVRGMRAEQIEFLSGDGSGRVLVKLDAMSLNMKYRSVLSPDMELQGWEVGGGEMKVPLASGLKNDMIIVSKLRASAYSEGAGVALRSLSGKVGGMRITVRVEDGDLLDFVREPHRLARLLPEADWKWLVGLFKHLEFIKNAKGSVVRLDLTLRPNPAAPSDWDLTAKLTGGPLVYRNWKVDRVEGSLVLKSGKGILDHLTVSNSSGDIRLSGFREMADAAWQFQLESTVNLVQAARAVRKRELVSELREGKQRLSASGVWKRTPEEKIFRAMGEFEMEDFWFRGTDLTRVSADFFTNGLLLRLDRLMCQTEEGRVEGSAEVEAGAATFALEGVHAYQFMRMLPRAGPILEVMEPFGKADKGLLPRMLLEGIWNVEGRTLEANLRPRETGNALQDMAARAFLFRAEGSLDQLKWTPVKSSTWLP